MGRYLRIGLVRNSQPFEERLLPMGADITLGKAAGNTFVVPNADVPKSTTIFKALGPDRHALCFGNPNGRVDLVEGEPELLGDLVKKGLAERHERSYQLPLTARARGKFDVGDVTVLFHYVERDLALSPVKATGPRPMVLETVLTWEGTVLSTRKWDPVRPVTMGPGPTCDIQLPGRVLEARAYTIIDGDPGPGGGRFYVDLRNPFITVASSDAREPPAERHPLKGPFAMTLALREGFSLEVRYAPALARPASSPFDIQDPQPFLCLAGSALFHAAIMLVAFAIGQGLLDPGSAKAKRAERRRELSAMLQEQKVEAKQEEAKKEAEKKEEEKKPDEDKEAKPEPRPTPRTKPQDAAAQTPEARRTKLKESVRGKTFLGVLGGEGENDGVTPVGRETQYADAFQDVQGDYAVNGAPSDALAPTGPQDGDPNGEQYKKLSADERGGQHLETSDVKTADKGAGEEAAVKVNVRTGALGGEGGLGKIDNSAVAGVFSRRIGAIKSCYEKELRRNPTLKGRITLRFTIGTSGRITNINASQNTTGDDAIASCIIGKVQNWKFDPPQGGAVTFTYPFILEAR